MKDRYVAGFWKNDDTFRVLPGYLGETFPSLAECEADAAEEGLAEYHDLVFCKLVPVYEEKAQSPEVKIEGKYRKWSEVKKRGL